MHPLMIVFIRRVSITLILNVYFSCLFIIYNLIVCNSIGYFELEISIN